MQSALCSVLFTTPKKNVGSPPFKGFTNEQKCYKIPKSLVFGPLIYIPEIPFCRKVAGKCCKVAVLESWLAKRLQSDIYLCELSLGSGFCITGPEMLNHVA